MKNPIRFFAAPVPALALTLALAITAIAPTLTSCTPDESSGTSEITIPGVEGNWTETFLSEIHNGESYIKGLYSTTFKFYIYDGQGGSMQIDFTAFHNSASFAPGTYTFPSTGSGTALGKLAIFTGGPGPADLSGDAVSGSVNVAVSGKTYTVTFNNVSMFAYKIDDNGTVVDSATRQISFKYTGRAEHTDGSSWGNKPSPQYGKSTIEERTTGSKADYMQLVVTKISDPGISPGHMIQLSSLDFFNTRSLLVSALLNSGEGTLKSGTYTFGESGEGTFSGWLTVDDLGADISSGEITIAESGGSYTITLTGVAGDVHNSDDVPSLQFNGTYTGGRFNNDDL
jgi:hypothetical protein